MAISTRVNEHTHQYDANGTARQTDMTNGHSHPIERDGDGNAVRIGETLNHTHGL